MTATSVYSNLVEIPTKKSKVTCEENCVVVSIKGLISEIEALKLKKEILDLVAVKKHAVDLIFQFNENKIPDQAVKETLSSLALIRQIRKVAFTGNFSPVRFPLHLFGAKSNLKFYKSNKEALSWLSK